MSIPGPRGLSCPGERESLKGPDLAPANRGERPKVRQRATRDTCRTNKKRMKSGFLVLGWPRLHSGAVNHFGRVLICVWSGSPGACVLSRQIARISLGRSQRLRWLSRRARGIRPPRTDGFEPSLAATRSSPVRTRTPGPVLNRNQEAREDYWRSQRDRASRILGEISAGSSGFPLKPSGVGSGVQRIGKRSARRAIKSTATSSNRPPRGTSKTPIPGSPE